MRLRSTEWFERSDEIGLQARSVLRTLGWSREFFQGKPVIGIANSWSELNNCSLSLPDLAAAVKRGVIAAGGVPLEFNTISLGEELMKPSAMLYRNLMAMEIEETLRAYPLDGVVLLCGCDKTTPAQLMAVASANLPSIQVCAGPKAAGHWRGLDVGSGTDLWHYWDQYRSGKINKDDWDALEACYSCGVGTCNTMGTASTMTVLSEALGMMLPGSATIPAADSRRRAAAEQSGARAVELVRANLRPRDIMTRSAFDNALRVYAALGGSTNAVIHLLALAGRLRIPLVLEDFDRISRETPTLLDLQPSGARLMTAFDAAGGLPALLARLGTAIDSSAITVTGTNDSPVIGTVAVTTTEDATLTGTLTDFVTDADGDTLIDFVVDQDGDQLAQRRRRFPSAHARDNVRHRARCLGGNDAPYLTPERLVADRVGDDRNHRALDERPQAEVRHHARIVVRAVKARRQELDIRIPAVRHAEINFAREQERQQTAALRAHHVRIEITRRMLAQHRAVLHVRHFDRQEQLGVIRCRQVEQRRARRTCRAQTHVELGRRGADLRSTAL
ncbi:hypothetical protein HC891_28015, partial [Candidatus Gracilibacteria bacterium]|nr:hypothetical protein [Candidatus Gracilibacteria bacterium]